MAGGILRRNDSASEEKGSWGFSKEAWLPGEHVYKKVLGEGKATSSAAGTGDAGNLRVRLRVPARAHGPEARTRREGGAPGSPRGYRSPGTAALGAAPQDTLRERPPRLASQSDRGSRPRQPKRKGTACERAPPIPPASSSSW